MKTIFVTFIATVLCTTSAAAAVIDLRLANTRFAHGSTIEMPPTWTVPLEIWVDDTPSAIEVSSIRVYLNENAVTAFAQTNRLPRGVRIIIKLGLTLGADFALKRDAVNVLTFSATDEARLLYSAKFYLVLDDDVTMPRIARRQFPPPQEVIQPAPSISQPKIVFGSDTRVLPKSNLLALTADVDDNQGLRRIVIEVNGEEEQEVSLQNESPIRKHHGTIKTGLPGTVTGDGRHVHLELSLRLRRSGPNVIGIRAENIFERVERKEITMITGR